MKHNVDSENLGTAVVIVTETFWYIAIIGFFLSQLLEGNIWAQSTPFEIARLVLTSTDINWHHRVNSLLPITVTSVHG